MSKKSNLSPNKLIRGLLFDGGVYSAISSIFNRLSLLLFIVCGNLLFMFIYLIRSDARVEVGPLNLWHLAGTSGLLLFLSSNRFGKRFDDALKRFREEEEKAFAEANASSAAAIAPEQLTHLVRQFQVLAASGTKYDFSCRQEIVDEVGAAIDGLGASATLPGALSLIEQRAKRLKSWHEYEREWYILLTLAELRIAELKARQAAEASSGGEDEEEAEGEEGDDGEDGEEGEDEEDASRIGTLAKSVRGEFSYLDDVQLATRRAVREKPSVAATYYTYLSMKQSIKFWWERIKERIRGFLKLLGLDGILIIIANIMRAIPAVGWTVRIAGTLFVGLFLAFFHIGRPVLRVVRNPSRIFLWIGKELGLRSPGDQDDMGDDDDL